MIETTLKIDGMMCGMCEAHVSDVIRSKFNIKKVSASHSKGQAVILSDGPLGEAALRKAIGDTGCTVTDVTLRPFEKKGCLACSSADAARCPPSLSPPFRRAFALRFNQNRL